MHPGFGGGLDAAAQLLAYGRYGRVSSLRQAHQNNLQGVQSAAVHVVRSRRIPMYTDSAVS